MSTPNYSGYAFGITGIIKVNSPEGIQKITTPDLKETLMIIDAINILRRKGQNVKKQIKDDRLLTELTQKIFGDIEVISHEAT